MLLISIKKIIQQIIEVLINSEMDFKFKQNYKTGNKILIQFLINLNFLLSSY
jgi:hypothetical protein